MGLGIGRKCSRITSLLTNATFGAAPRARSTCKLERSCPWVAPAIPYGSKGPTELFSRAHAQYPRRGYRHVSVSALNQGLARTSPRLRHVSATSPPPMKSMIWRDVFRVSPMSPQRLRAHSKDSLGYCRATFIDPETTHSGKKDYDISDANAAFALVQRRFCTFVHRRMRYVATCIAAAQGEAWRFYIGMI
jgi:hypothetical protein